MVALGPDAFETELLVYINRLSDLLFVMARVNEPSRESARGRVVNERFTLERAYAHCERVARDHYENFPVASRLLPVSMRPHIAAIYAFARRADDYADEPGFETAERLRLLDEWESRLRRTVETRGLEPLGGRRRSAARRSGVSGAR